MRIDDYKYRFIDQPDGWLGEKTHPDVPYITNLRLDPFERMGWPDNGTKEGRRNTSTGSSIQFWRFVFVQQVGGKELPRPSSNTRRCRPGASSTWMRLRSRSTT